MSGQHGGKILCLDAQKMSVDVKIFFNKRKNISCRQNCIHDFLVQAMTLSVTKGIKKVTFKVNVSPPN